MISQKTLKIAMGVGMVLCATASFAGVSEGFESATDGAIGTNIPDWAGDGIVTNVGPTYAKTVGTPRGEATNSKTLLVEGEVTCANTATTAETTASVSDFLVYIPELSDELETDGLTDAKIAIAAGTALSNDKIPLMLYCKAAAGETASWVQIKEVDSNTWYRVTLVFKDSRCRVSLDGEPVKSASGYTASTGVTTGGAWYDLANTQSNLGIASLSFIGCAKLDDVVISAYTEDAAFLDTAVATVNGESVSYNNLNKWNMTASDLSSNWDTVLNQTSGMTVGNKLLCGLDPTTATKFEPLTVTPTGANTATITFPCEDASKTKRYSLVAEGGTAVFTGGATSITVSEGVATANITLTPATGSKVVKFWLKADNSNNGNN